jgi:hypothetical protein
MAILCSVPSSATIPAYLLVQQSAFDAILGRPASKLGAGPCNMSTASPHGALADLNCYKKYSHNEILNE